MTNAPGAETFDARVVESFGRRALVIKPGGEKLAIEVFGKRLSCVCGDEVSVRAEPGGDVPRVVAVRPRRTLFARTDSRGRTEPLAANATVLVALLASEPEPDGFVIDRYLAGAALAGMRAMVVVNKSELASAHSAQFLSLVSEFRDAGYEVLQVSAVQPASVAPVAEKLRGEIAILVGQSGVGKTTLTNALAPDSERATRTLSDSTGEGRHTTVSTALFRLREGGELIDSPGVRDYAPPLVEDANVQMGWPELLRLAPSCRFNNCMHLREPGCAVTGAVAAGTLAARRYESYKRLLNIMRGLAPDYQRR